jgi:hypothetical protein
MIAPITNDRFSENSPVYIFLTILSIIGIYDILNEVTQDYDDYLSKNYVKKIILFSVIYMKTSSIYTASLISIIFFLLFPKVFFGEQTKFKKC